MSVGTIDKNGTFFDTATNVPIDVSVKTRRNQAAVNKLTADSVKHNLKKLWVGLQNKASDAKHKAGDLVEKAEVKVKDVTNKATDAAVGGQAKPNATVATAPAKAKDEGFSPRASDDASGYGASGYTPNGSGNRR